MLLEYTRDLLKPAQSTQFSKSKSINANQKPLKWILIAFPPLHRRIGTGALLRLCAFVWVLAFAAWPFANKFLKNGWVAPFWTLAVIFNIVGSGVSMAFSKFLLPLCLSLYFLNGRFGSG